MTADRVDDEGIDPAPGAAGRQRLDAGRRATHPTRCAAGGADLVRAAGHRLVAVLPPASRSARASATRSCSKARATASRGRRASTRCYFPQPCPAAAADRSAVVEAALPGHDQQQQSPAARARHGALARPAPRGVAAAASWPAGAIARSPATAIRPACAPSRRFRKFEDFDLFGEGWDERHPAVDPSLHAAAAARVPRTCRRQARRCWPAIASALVFENTRFPGYVSEKLFDCFFARCIPIYSGAPDVAQYVPPAAFIDARQFATYADLERFLRGITEADARRYLDAAHAFLASPAYESLLRRSLRPRHGRRAAFRLANNLHDQ